MSCRPCWNNNSICATDSACPGRQQVSVFYFVTTVVGMILLALFTLLFLFCLFLKRRRIQLRLNPHPRAFETTVTFYSSSEPALPVTNPATSAADPTKTPASPFTCVIMAGEDQPTFIAHPIPSTTSTSPPEPHHDTPNQTSSQASTDVKS